VNCSLVEGWRLTHQALAHFHSSQLYLLAKPTQSSRFRLPVHDYISLPPVDPLRKINNLAAGQFTTLFHGYTSWFDVGMESGGRHIAWRSATNARSATRFISAVAGEGPTETTKKIGS
jgi:hypothetical protein